MDSYGQSSKDEHNEDISIQIDLLLKSLETDKKAYTSKLANINILKYFLYLIIPALIIFCYLLLCDRQSQEFIKNKLDLLPNLKKQLKFSELIPSILFGAITTSPIWMISLLVTRQNLIRKTKTILEELEKTIYIKIFKFCLNKLGIKEISKCEAPIFKALSEDTLSENKSETLIEASGIYSEKETKLKIIQTTLQINKDIPNLFIKPNNKKETFLSEFYDKLEYDININSKLQIYISYKVLNSQNINFRLVKNDGSLENVTGKITNFFNFGSNKETYINFDNTEFNKYFLISSNDEINVKKIFDIETMNNFLKLKDEKIKCNLNNQDLSFEIYIEGNPLLLPYPPFKQLPNNNYIENNVLNFLKKICSCHELFNNKF